MSVARRKHLRTLKDMASRKTGFEKAGIQNRLNNLRSSLEGQVPHNRRRFLCKQPYRNDNQIMTLSHR